MTDSGKHSALRQTDDGSFELVFDREGLQEVSEEEVSFAEVAAPETPATRTSSRVLVFSAAGVAVVLLLAAIGWWALAPGKSGDESGVDEVTGFKPYVGGAEGAEAAAEQKAARRAKLAAFAEADEPEDPVEVEVEVVEEVVEEAEPGWELSEQSDDGVVVEVEGTDTDEDVVEVVDAEEIEELDTDELPATDARALMPQKRLEALRNANLGRTIQSPRMPALSNNPLGVGRKLPIRNLQPAPTDEDVVEGEAIEEVDDEVDEEDVDGEELQ